MQTLSNPPITDVPVYSLPRFFCKKKLSFPCQVGGLFHSKSEKEFELHSQGFSLSCKRNLKQANQMSSLQSGDWILVEIVKEEKEYKLKNWKNLASGSEPHLTTLSLKALENWNNFLSSVKTFLSQRGLTFVETPSIVESPGTEPHLLPFETKQIFPNKKTKNRFLITSPEMHLKKLLCEGWTDIFEIKKCFRNGEMSLTHQPEFYMLEWYRSFFSLEDLIDELLSLLKHLSEKNFFKSSFQPAQIKTVSGLFLECLDFKLTSKTREEELARLLDKHQIPYSAALNWEELFNLLFLNRIEPSFPKNIPLIVRDYPLSLRGFAKKNNRGFAERFELYWRGFELANAFYEVTNSQEQEKLFQSHLQQRTDSVPHDRELLNLMKTKGMPPCSGIALGLDRLFTAICAEKDISFFKTLPQSLS